MPSYDYRCNDEKCGVVQEFFQSIHKPLPESMPCPKCGGDSFHVFLVAPGVLTANMTHQSIDVAIGRDAEARWGQIHERRAMRDSVRKKTGKTGITAVGEDGVVTYKPNDKTLTSVETPEPKAEK